ncbi:MAG: glycerate kinase [Phormidesmis sp.]
MVDLSANSPLLADTRSAIWPMIIAWGKGHPPPSDQYPQLVAWELKDPNRSAAWQLCAENIDAALQDRAALLQSLLRSTDQTLNSQNLEAHSLDAHRLPPALWTSDHWIDSIVPLWTLWLPLAQYLDQQQKALGAPFIQGILGGQGTGKTTLTLILQRILQQLGHRSIGLSLDDLYLTYAQRRERQRQDPRLIWRGPPGTHDIELGQRTLSQLKHASPSAQITLPQFDKSLYQGQGDRIAPITHSAPTIVLFEGWFVGVRPLLESSFTDDTIRLPAPIVTQADRQFAADSNRRLLSYLPLWDFLDGLMVLYPEDYRLSQRWRQQAEHAMKAQGKGGLSDREISDFVTYFWKALHPQLFITPLTQSSFVHLVAQILADHSLGELFAPSAGYAYPI